MGTLTDRYIQSCTHSLDAQSRMQSIFIGNEIDKSDKGGQNF